MSAAAVLKFRRRADAIAAMLARAAQEGSDVGDLLAAACRQAAARVRVADPCSGGTSTGAEALVSGRPGSWEAEHVRELAGGWEYEEPS